MKTKLAVLLLVLLGAGGSLFGQNPTAVSGIITDPNGVAYYPATVTACLTPVTTSPIVNGQHVNPNEGTNYCAPLTNTTSTGFFSLSLFPNSAITPGGTQWRFTVTAAGTAPPAGKGSQTFQVSITISGTSQDVGATLTAASLALLNSGGGGITSFSRNVIDVTQAPYNVVPGLTVPDATFTIGQNTISCSNNDCNFTSAMNGWICFGTNLLGDTSVISPGVTVVLPQGIFTQTGAQTGTCSGGNATTTVTALGVLVLGSDASSGSTAAWNAAVLSCSTVQLPAGIILVQTAEFNTPSVQDKCIIDRNGGYSTLGVQGWGSANTTIVPTPNFSPASCTGTLAADGCFFGSPAIQVTDLSIWGAGVSAIGAGFNGKIGVHLTGAGAVTAGSNSYIYNVLLASWGATTAGFTGFKIDNESNALAVGVHLDGMGSTGCVFTPMSGGNINLYNQFCAVNNVTSMIVSSNAGGAVNSYGGVYGFGTAASTSAVEVGPGGAGNVTFNSFGDTAPYATGSGGTQFQIHNGAVCHIHDAILVNATSTGKALTYGTSGATVTIENSLIQETGAGASPAIQSAGASSQLFDLGGNTISSTNGKAVDLTSGGQFYPNPTSTYTGTVTDINAGLTGTGACATITTIVGTGLVGTLTCTGTTGASTIVITPHFTAPHNWVCAASDLTTANTLRQSATSTTTCTLAGTVNQNDVLTFTAIPY